MRPQILSGMTVYIDPLRTESRYRQGLTGVEASLNRLEDACEEDWQRICSVLGDIAWCLEITTDDVPFGSHDSSVVSMGLSELRDAVRERDHILVRELLVEMLDAMKLHWRVNRQCERS